MTKTKQYHVYFNDGVNEMAEIGAFDNLAKAKTFAVDNMGDEFHDGDSDYLLSTARTAQMEIYDGLAWIINEDGEHEPTFPIWVSDYFYTD